MGAVVRAFDVRAAVREQVESMGAEFLEAGSPTLDLSLQAPHPQSLP